MIVFAITVQMTIRISHQRRSVRKAVLTNYAKFILNGQQQHKGVIFHWSKVSPSMVKLF